MPTLFVCDLGTEPRSRIMRPVATFALAFSLVGCTSSPDDQTQEQDIAEYEALAAALDASRQVFDEAGGQDLVAAKGLLFWADLNAGNPVLRSYDIATSQRTAYNFSVVLPIGNGQVVDRMNFQVSERAIATMNAPDGARVYRAGNAEMLLGKLTLPAPPFGQKYWAYAMDGDQLYVAVQKPDDTRHTLQRWTPGASAPTDLLVFDDAIAPNPLTEFINFTVAGDLVMFNDHGRVWIAHTTGGKATWIQNDEEITGLAFDGQGAVYDQHGTFYRYDFATDTRVNLSDKLEANEFRINKTFANAHLPSQGGVTFTLSGTRIIYVGNGGLFSYDHAADIVEPILLHPRGDLRIDYIHPVVAGAMIFVTGLQSTSGSVGSEGPFYSVPMP
jgi:hypothetical protein